MKGVVLGYNDSNRKGHILANDTRFLFSIDDWLGDVPPKNGITVDFVNSNNTAVDIYISSNVKHTANDASIGNVKKLYYAYLAGTILPFVSIISVFLSYSYKKHANQVDVIHYEYQIQTFWRTLHYQIIGALLFKAGLLGIVIIIFSFVFYIIRNVKGVVSIDSSTNLDIHWMDPLPWIKDSWLNIKNKKLFKRINFEKIFITFIILSIVILFMVNA